MSINFNPASILETNIIVDPDLFDDIGPEEAIIEMDASETEWRFVNGTRVPVPNGYTPIDLGVILGADGFDEVS